MTDEHTALFVAKAQCVTDIMFPYRVETKSKCDDEEKEDDGKLAEGYKHVSEHDHVNSEVWELAYEE